ncbi:hypothetical protein [Streptomyces sp. HUAS ZL42]|uniref:hypothetical protein n=1 Tax=Streptomyces sp. HUAS ZL42 TaxID=3231715 RepID=UPI00345F0DE2
MTDGSWAERLAARVAGDTRAAKGEPRAGRSAPAWARLAADRAGGKEADPETVAEVRRAAQRPRSEWEQRLLERLGHGDDETPPAA